MPKGALHIHSSFSDGEFSIAELREVYLAAGCRFACVTDHADWFDRARLDDYVQECARHSDARFLFIPGLEYPCDDRMHIVGYGVTVLTELTEPAAVIRHIRQHHGLAVVAHPKDSHFDRIEALDPLPDGLEVWNSKYDGRYGPRPRTFALLRRMQAGRPGVRAFYGQDLHWRAQYRGLFVHVGETAVTRTTVLQSLKAGAFYAEKDGMRLPSSGLVPEALLNNLARAHGRSERLRRLLRATKRVVERLGVSVPAGLKARARRVM